MQHDYNGEALRNALSQLPTAPQVRLFEEIDSTNAEARRSLINGEEGCILYLANRQTAGRGRLGRSFHSPETGVYLSLLFPLTSSLPSAVSVTCAASVAVMHAIRSVTGIQTEIKWVNDLYLQGKKVCGILTEAVTIGHRTALIVGIGINLRTSEFPPELCGIAGSLEADNASKEALVIALLQELIPFLQSPEDHRWLADYRRFSCVLGKPVTWVENGVASNGVAIGIDGDGALTLQTDNGKLQTLRTGEISLRLL